MELKDRVKHLRLAKNKTLTELGVEMGKTESACRSWELGRTKPDADTLIRLAKYFGCTADFLLGLSEYDSYENAAIAKELPLNNELIIFLKKHCDDEELQDVLNQFFSDQRVLEFFLSLKFGIEGSLLNPSKMREQNRQTFEMFESFAGKEYFISDNIAEIVRKGQFSLAVRILESIYDDMCEAQHNSGSET